MGEFFVFHGVNSRDLGIYLSAQPKVSAPKPMLETTSIPGRNGDLHFHHGSYQNRSVDMECFSYAGGIDALMRQLGLWALLPEGYGRLECSWDPEIYMLAHLTSGPETAFTRGCLAEFSLTFDCKPQKFLKSGERPISMTVPGTLYNSGFPALPLITVYGEGAGKVSVGGIAVQINSIDGYVMLDCDLQNAYKGTENKNSTISAPEFPVLQSGENLVSWAGGISRLEIVPRWWVL